MLNLSKLKSAAPETATVSAEMLANFPAVAALAAFDNDAALAETARDNLLTDTGRELVYAISGAVGELTEAELFDYYRDRKAFAEAPFVKAAVTVTSHAKAVYGYDSRSDARKAAWRKMESRALTVGMALGYLRANEPEIATGWDSGELSLSALATNLPKGSREANKSAKEAEAEAALEATIAEEIAARGFVDVAQMQVLTVSEMAMAIASALDNGHFAETDGPALAQLFDSVDAFRAARAKALTKPRKAA